MSVVGATGGGGGEGGGVRLQTLNEKQKSYLQVAQPQRICPEIFTPLRQALRE